MIVIAELYIRGYATNVGVNTVNITGLAIWVNGKKYWLEIPGIVYLKPGEYSEVTGWGIVDDLPRINRLLVEVRWCNRIQCTSSLVYAGLPPGGEYAIGYRTVTVTIPGSVRTVTTTVTETQTYTTTVPGTVTTTTVTQTITMTSTVTTTTTTTTTNILTRYDVYVNLGSEYSVGAYSLTLSVNESTSRNDDNVEVLGGFAEPYSIQYLLIGLVLVIPIVIKIRKVNFQVLCPSCKIFRFSQPKTGFFVFSHERNYC